MGFGGSPSSLLNLLLVWLEVSGASTIGGIGGADGTGWVKGTCGWRPEVRAMICSCLAAEGEHSKWEGTDKGLATGKELRWDWPDPNTVWANGQLFSPASGLLTGDAWLVGAAAIGWGVEVCRGAAAR